MQTAAASSFFTGPYSIHNGIALSGVYIFITTQISQTQRDVKEDVELSAVVGEFYTEVSDKKDRK